VLEAGNGTKFLTNSANPTLWTLFGSHKELGARQYEHFYSQMKKLNNEQRIIVDDILYQKKKSPLEPLHIFLT
jgi:hypothetical protein